jgi:hypothetical protein
MYFYMYIILQRKKVTKKSQNSKNQGLTDPGVQNLTDLTDPEHWAAFCHRPIRLCYYFKITLDSFKITVNTGGRTCLVWVEAWCVLYHIVQEQLLGTERNSVLLNKLNIHQDHVTVALEEDICSIRICSFLCKT